MSKIILPIEFKNNTLYVLDQRKLPHEEIIVEVNSIEDAFIAIKDMLVRGAPCIGFTGIFALALWLKTNDYSSGSFKEACDFIKSARPTAVNLAFEVDRVFKLLLESKKKNYFEEVVIFGNEQITTLHSHNLAMAKEAANILKNKFSEKKLNLLTHCNTGFLACGTMGTALGVIEYLGNEKIENVWVDETRPYLQGSRLTAYELTKLEIPFKIVVEGAASYLMSNNLVDAIFVGADRIAANGDTANKVGTANLSILAKYFNIPFYIVAPKSSFDINTLSAKDIEIELRPDEEITYLKDIPIAPIGAKTFNPSFDIALGENITGIICEDGLLSPPFAKSIKEIF